MTLFLQILRVVCGVAAVAAGGWLLKEFIKDALHRSLSFTLGAAFVLMLFALLLIGSGVLNFVAVWS